MIVRVAVSVLVLVLSSPAQTTWHVDVNATPPGNGTPQSPYASIQHAIAQPTTVSGDRILVAPGTYNEAIDFLGKTLIVRGTAGAASTVLDGTGLGSSIVRIASGEGPGTRLQGFHLTRAGTSSFNLVGGGVFCSGSTVELRECRLSDSGGYPDWVGRGAAAAVDNGTLTLVRCRVDGCLSQYEGGAVYASGSNLRIDSSSFAGCVTGGDGGAVASDGSDVEILRSTFQDNLVGDGHGGALELDGSTARIADSAFVGNSAIHSHSGGAVRAVQSTLVVERCRFELNQAASGGAISAGPSLAVRDCLFVRNRAGVKAQSPAAGSAIVSTLAAPVERSLFWGNTTDATGFLGSREGAVYGCILDRCTLYANETFPAAPGSAASFSTLRDCIVWGNLPSAGTLDNCTTTYSDVDVPTSGTGNIHADPQLVVLGAGDLRLLAGSPCIDAGDPASAPDPDGSRADMGAFPFFAAYGPPPKSECQGKVNSLGCVPYMGHNGVPASVSGGLFVAYGRNELANTYGLLVWSPQRASIPFQGGFLCVGSPRWRTPLQSSGSVIAGADCPGEFRFAWSSAYLASVGLSAGTGVHAQFWGRDAADPNGSSLTDALAFHLVP